MTERIDPGRDGVDDTPVAEKPYVRKKYQTVADEIGERHVRAIWKDLFDAKTKQDV